MLLFGGEIHVSLKCSYSKVSSEAGVSLVIFCLGDLSIDVSTGTEVPYCYCTADYSSH